MRRSTSSERALVLAPLGRDAALAAAVLAESGLEADACPTLPALITELDAGAAFVIVTEEALAGVDVTPLAGWLREQQAWSDLPFVLLTRKGGGLERNPLAQRFNTLLGNVTFLERPFHPTTLVSLARSALRARRRQYEARARLAELRESEYRYRRLFENIDEGFCIIEFLDGPRGALDDYVHVEANPAYTQHAGLLNVVGQRVRELVAPHEADEWVSIYRRVLVDGHPIRFERRLAETDRHLDLAAFRIEPPSRRQVAVIFRDISARKRAEAALQHLNETLEQRVAQALAEQKVFADIVEATDAMVQVLDNEGRWLALNQSASDEFERAWGLRPAVGQSLEVALRQHPRVLDQLRPLWRRALAGESFTHVAEVVDRTGEHRHHEMRFAPLRDEGGRQIGAYQFVHDVSARLVAEQRLREAEEALGHSQKLEAIGQLTGGVAHDFNNLLTVIKASTALLRRADGDAQARQRHIDAISQTVDRAARLTGQLLAFARRQALKPEVFDAAARVRTVADMLRAVVGSRIRIDLQLDEGCFVEADVNQFETSLVNMAVNARDAMSGEGRLGIRVSRDGERFVSVAISDSGVGIPGEMLRQIFEPFFTTKGIGKGTGLGLSQVYGFAKQSGGDVSVTSEVGVGTTFTLQLPIADGASAEAVATLDPRGSKVLEGGGRRILVVEDNGEVGALTAQLLQDVGFEVTWSRSGADALAELASGRPYDLVFSDVVMAGMSGIKLGEEVRRLYPGLPVVLTSGYSEVLAQQGRHGFELLQKPYSAEDLTRLLDRVSRVRT